MIKYIDRKSREEKSEKIYGEFFIKLLYDSPCWSKILLPLWAKLNFMSRLYGWFQKSPLSRFKVKRFIRNYQIDTREFLDPVDSFKCFNDFFIRKMKPRNLSHGNDIALMPADARYFVYENIEKMDGFYVKGHMFSLDELLCSYDLGMRYIKGSMAIARLAPVDYHRFHFPTNCKAGHFQAIPGDLYSVNPVALKRDIHILSRNKRVITPLHTRNFGTILSIEIGATYVGTIHQTFIPDELYAKGDEKGYFSFGGSCLILLFEPGVIQLDQDLIESTHRGLETLGRYGDSLGRALSPH